MRVHTFLGTIALTLGLWNAAQANSINPPVIDTQTVAGVVQVFQTSLSHRFDSIHLQKSHNFPVQLRHVVQENADIPTFADVDKASQTCVMDVNLGQINTILGKKGWSAMERDFFVKFAVLHERFHCVAFNDKEAVWLPGSHDRERLTSIFADQANPNPMTVFIPHPAAYEFLHEEMADGMALLALLQDAIDPATLDPHASIGKNIPPHLQKIVSHLVNFRLQSSLHAGDAHGTLRMLDFILKQSGATLQKPLGEWYSKIKEEGGFHLMDVYKRSGMETIVDDNDMWYDMKTAAINMSLEEAQKMNTVTYKEKIVTMMRKQLADQGIMIQDDHNADGIQQLDKKTIKTIDTALQNQTLGWFDGLEWNKRVEELRSVNEAYQAYQSATSLNLETLKDVEAQDRYLSGYQSW